MSNWVLREGIWNILLCEAESNKIIGPDNNPKKSGRYLCTCVQFTNGEEINRYLQVMDYDANRNCWHDCGTKHGITHNILAWTENVPVCSFQDYEYEVGGCLMKKDTNIEHENFNVLEMRRDSNMNN